jgi:hypothetical protein
MTTTYKRLSDLQTEIADIYKVYQLENMALSKRIELYNKATMMITEARKLLADLKNEIAATDVTKSVTKNDIANMNKWTDMMSYPNLNFDELLEMVNNIKMISNGLPTTAKIIDNVEHEVIHDMIADVEDF